MNIPNKEMPGRRAAHDPFPGELRAVLALMSAIGCNADGYHNPNAKHGRETGADVSFTLDGKTFGVQVTDIDGGQPYTRGQLRGEEMRIAVPGRPYAMFSNNDPNAAIVAAVLGKIAKAKRYRFGEFDEVFLLVSGNRLDAPCSTFLLPATIDLAMLNAATHAPLAVSPYVEVFVHLQIGRAVYRWFKPEGWRPVIEPEDWRQPPGYDFWSIQRKMRMS